MLWLQNPKDMLLLVCHRNNVKDRYNINAPTQKGGFGINIHRSSKTGSGINVNNWSQGCQVFKNINQFNQFMMLCERQTLSKKSFTYTLCDMNDFNNFQGINRHERLQVIAVKAFERLNVVGVARRTLSASESTHCRLPFAVNRC